MAQTAGALISNSAYGVPITPSSEDCESKSINSHCGVTMLPKGLTINVIAPSSAKLNSNLPVIVVSMHNNQSIIFMIDVLAVVLWG